MASRQFEYSLQDKGPYFPSVETISTHIAETHKSHILISPALIGFQNVYDEKDRKHLIVAYMR